MKNHFIFSYFGNKRNEAQYILNNIDITKYKTIVEPFCGSSAVSYYISTLYPKKFKYILNDNDINLINLYNIMKDEEKINIFDKEINKLMAQIINKEEYNNIVKNDTLYGWFIGKKICSIRPGLYNLKYKYNKDKPFTIREYPIYTFLKNEDVEIYSNDAIDIIKKYNNDINNFLFLDPPYLELCNDFYSSKYNVNIYEWIYYNNIPYHNATYCLILEKMWIIDLLFKNMYKIEYDKIYSTSKKKTIHYLIFNKNINNDTINNDTTTIISRKAGVHYNI